MRYGMGGWHDTKKDIRAKVIFTNDKRSAAPGDCFVMAMDRPEVGGQICHKQYEATPGVERIYRSNTPDEIQKIISIRELINVRQGLDCPTWWHM